MVEIANVMEAAMFGDAYSFLKEVSPFRGMEDSTLLPIITRLGLPKSYGFGEYIQR